jgi:hypothetical protein
MLVTVFGQAITKTNSFIPKLFFHESTPPKLQR